MIIHCTLASDCPSHQGLLVSSYFFRVTVTGIYRATPLRPNPRQRNVRAVYKTHVDVIHFRKTDKNRLHEKDPDSATQFSQERIDQLKELAGQPDIYDRLARALGEGCSHVVMYLSITQQHSSQRKLGICKIQCSVMSFFTLKN